uniref:DUF2442 domain-containing protein n=1 Tax=Candidatus Kentrum sp. FM TaxID=2126340 RepID=A0A450WNB8_9GAMM|nr:MAG: Protein of unknown function (DUF2442) [Candidatus Kentron sp. FM]VFJ71303.1 MAG: Protein of unknown function (DUF2442) [Candidatus Kentron sp. FM]VFK18551.1 MAG: Protein of unknown function (DUF2442) [Candidatus Kentron sp. FM]
MKLQSFQNTGFKFSLLFVDGKTIQADLQPLIGAHISEEDLVSARIDPDWGCLEFCDGAVDIEPVTLYRYAANHRDFSFPHADVGTG